MTTRHELFLLLALLGSVSISQAEDTVVQHELSIKDHQFIPSELSIVAGEKVKLTIRNEDSTPEEFESRSLKREKIIPGNSQVVMTIGPLKPGTYEFFGEFHESTAKGRITVK
ncbi:MAG: cupredoxin domain-containing protein [Methylococcaceae bacterium]